MKVDWFLFAWKFLIILAIASFVSMFLSMGLYMSEGIEEEPSMLSTLFMAFYIFGCFGSMLIFVPLGAYTLYLFIKKTFRK